MSSRYSSCLSFTGPNSFCCSTCVKPMIAFSGVLSSWLMFARNSDLCLLATSSAFVRSATLRSRPPISSCTCSAIVLKAVASAPSSSLRSRSMPLVVGAGPDRLGRHLHALDRAHQPAGKQDRERDRGQDEGGDQQCRLPDLPAQRGEGGALGLLDEHLPADQPDGRPGAQHLYAVEVPADSRSGARRSQGSRHLGKRQGAMCEIGAARERDGVPLSSTA